MSSALTGNKIKDSYQALLKIGTNGSLDPTTPISISDGLGNDTPLQLAADKLLTNYGGNAIGLNLDFNNNAYSLGDFSNITNNTLINIDSNIGQIYIQSHTDAVFIGDGFYDQYNTCLVVNDNLQNIKTTFQNNDIGLYIDFNSIYCALGDYNANVGGTSFFVDDSHNTIFTQYNSNFLGLSFDFFARLLNFGDFIGYYGPQNYLQFDGFNNNAILQNGNGNIYLGDYLGNYFGTVLNINDINQTINTSNLIGYIGINVDFNNSIFQFGDFGSIVNAWQTTLKVDPNNFYISFINKVIEMGITQNDGCFFTTGKLTFNGVSLQSNSSSGNSGEHLVINLNGVQYKIKLELP